MATAKIMYLVNANSITSIPLEVAKKIDENYKDLDLVIYYKEKSSSDNPLVSNTIYIEAVKSFDVSAIKKSIQLLKKKPSVIHAHHTFSTFLFFGLAKIFTPSTRLIKTIHTTNYSLRFDQKCMNLFIFLMADFLLCNSESTKESLSAFEKWITKYKTEVVYNGVDVERILNAPFPAAEKNKIIEDKDTRVIGSVGRMVKVKDFHTLIEAFDVLTKKSKAPLKLLLIGDGPEKEKLQEFVKKKELSNDVIFTGAVPRDKVYSYMKIIDVFVVPSIHEGFCNVLVEALAANKAVVCSNISTLREVGGDAVLFADTGKPNSFTEKINIFLENSEIETEYKNKAKDRAERFTLDACAKKYLDYYN